MGGAGSAGCGASAEFGRQTASPDAIGAPPVLDAVPQLKPGTTLSRAGGGLRLVMREATALLRRGRRR